MRARGRHLASLVLLIACIEACGLSVTGVATDAVVAGPDAATEPATDDADALDGADASAAEASDGADVDAGAPPTFCAMVSPAPTFCDDFDTGTDVTAKWDRSTGSPKRTTNMPSSGPAAFDAVTTSTGAATLLQKDFTVTKSVTVDLDVRYNAIPASGVLSSFILRPSNDGGGYLYLYVESDRSYMQVSMDEYSGSQYPTLTTGVWHHISATATIVSATKTTFSGSLDKVPYTGFPAQSAYPWQPNITVTVEVGVNPYAASGEIFVDNVVVRAN